VQFFVTKVNTLAPKTGSISYSTYFGGGNFTAPVIATGGGIAVDTNGNVYFTGTTNFTFTGCAGCGSTDFPILNAYQPCLNSAPPTTIVTPPTCAASTSNNPDAFVAKLNLNGNQGEQLVWSTYLGGGATDSGSGVALDSGAANVYVVGTTNSHDFASTGTVNTFASYQACLDQPGVAAGSCATTPPTATDAFVARLTNPAISTTTTQVNVALNYFSYLGGSGADIGAAIAVDSGSGALVTGSTQSADFPIFPTSNPIQSVLTGGQDAFVARLNTAAVVGQTTTASWASYYGGNPSDPASVVTEGTGITLDVNQNAYFAGATTSSDLFVSKQLQNYNAGYDAFAVQLGSAVSLSLSGVLTLGSSQTFISAGNQATFTYTLTNNGPDLATGITVTDNLSPTVTKVALTFVSASISSGTCTGVSTATTVSCSIQSLQSGSTATITIVVTPTGNGSQATFNGGTVQAVGQGNIVLAQTSVPANMSDYGMQVLPSNQSVPEAGKTATYQVQLTPHPLYISPITLSCTGLPTGATCNFTNNQITLSGPGASTLNITTTARPVVTPASAGLFARHFYALWLMIPGLALVGVGMDGGKRRRAVRILSLCSMFVTMFVLLLFLPACSSKSTPAPVSGTPAGTYTIPVTAASGSDSKSASVTLTVP
jgi:uncharacterized repeat protein (TIGR01451 family)